MKRKILITGGAGFIGSNLALYLNKKSKNNSIICFDNLIRKGSQLNVHRLKENGIQFVKGDIRNLKSLLRLRRIDTIIECSAEPSVLAAYNNPQYMIDTNLVGTINCLELAKREKSKFIYLSTSRIYPIDAINNISFKETKTRFDWTKKKGIGYGYKGIKESFPLEGIRSLYGTTKLCSEHVINEYNDMFGIKTVINRCGLVAGPWQMGKIDQGLIGFWIAQHVYKRKLSYIGYGGGGKQVRDVLHVDDLCRLIAYECSHINAVNGKTFNAGGGRKNSVSLNELTVLVQKTGKVTIPVKKIKSERKSDVRIFITDNAAVTKATGWRPKKSVSQTIDDTHSWIIENKNTLRNILTA